MSDTPPTPPPAEASPPPPTPAESLVLELELLAEVAEQTVRSNDAFKIVVGAILARLLGDARLIRDCGREEPPSSLSHLSLSMREQRREAGARLALADHYMTEMVRILVGERTP